MSLNLRTTGFFRAVTLEGAHVELHLGLIPAIDGALVHQASPSFFAGGLAALLAVTSQTIVEVRAARALRDPESRVFDAAIRVTPFGVGADGGTVAARARLAIAGVRVLFWLALLELVAWAALRPFVGNVPGLLVGAATTGGMLALAVLPFEAFGGAAIWDEARKRRAALRPRRAERVATAAEPPSDPLDEGPPSSWAVREAERIAKKELEKLRADRRR